MPAALDLDAMFRVRTGADRVVDEIREIVAEKARREVEGLRMYEPLPSQDRFHRSAAKTRLVRGSNRAGKTLPAAVEAARAFLGRDPYRKYPRRGTAYVVGYDYAHHGQTTYPKLFLPGAFKVIRDLDTGLMRAYRPWLPADLERAAEAQDAEPMIPDRMVAEVSWESKKESIPSFIRLTTGWEIWFFSGEGRPPRGQAIDFGWIDEEISGIDWHAELISRCIDRDGKVVWSASPQSGTDQLFELHELAEQLAGSEAPFVEEFVVRLMENPHLTAKAKAEAVMIHTGEAARVTRIEGEFLHSTQKIFHEYAPRVHGLLLPRVPDHWTLYASVDPGHQICAVLFAAVPPEDEQREVGRIVLYDELYIPKCDAAKFAAAFRGKVAGRWFQDFVVDMHGARITDMGSGKTVLQQYLAELKKLGVACAARGTDFAWGNDDLKGGVEHCRAAMRPGPGGPPGLRVVYEEAPGGEWVCRLPNFEFEVKRWRNKKVGDVVTDDPETRGRVHQMANLRYLCSHGLRYVPPRRPGPAESPAYREFVAKLRARQGRTVGLTLGVGRSEG